MAAIQLELSLFQAGDELIVSEEYIRRDVSFAATLCKCVSVPYNL
nr:MULTISPECIES: hypothetical protein [Clostridia]